MMMCTKWKTPKLLRSRDLIIEFISISAAGLQQKYGASEVCTTCFLFVIAIANGYHYPREIWVGTCPPRPTLGYATTLETFRLLYPMVDFTKSSRSFLCFSVQTYFFYSKMFTECLFMLSPLQKKNTSRNCCNS